jgi:hypothetical protein
MRVQGPLDPWRGLIQGIEHLANLENLGRWFVAFNLGGSGASLMVVSFRNARTDLLNLSAPGSTALVKLASIASLHIALLLAAVLFMAAAWGVFFWRPWGRLAGIAASLLMFSLLGFVAFESGELFGVVVMVVLWGATCAWFFAPSIHARFREPWDMTK